MLIMSAHEMLTLNATVGDASPSQMDGDSYAAANLCDGDPHNPIRTTLGTFSFSVTGAAALVGINGLVVSHHNLDEGLSVNFSTLGDVEMPAVPENDIRLNGVEILNPAAGSTASTTVSLSGSPANSNPCVIGEVFAGIFREVRSLAVGATFQPISYGIQHPGEFGGMAYDKGGEARLFGGAVHLNDAAKAILDAAWRASKANSQPTVIVPDASVNDAWVVTWETYDPQALHPGIWRVEVVWREVARLRWPA